MTGSENGPKRRERASVDASEQEWGSDLFADLLRAYGFEYAFYNPGSSFRGIAESVVNYNDDDPKVIETAHEAIAVAMAHGYAKATGEPGLCLLHDVVGTLHGAMGLYNAFWDRVPLLAVSGTGPTQRSIRRPHSEWIHSAQFHSDLVREYTKWDDQPAHVDDVTESFLRGMRFAETVPRGPVYLTMDIGIQEGRMDEPHDVPAFDDYAQPSKPAPDPHTIEAAADRLVAAEFPVVFVDYVGTNRETVDALVDLCEALAAPVFNVHEKPGSKLTPHRYNFPNTHPLDLTGTEAYREADVVLALDTFDLDMKLTDADPVDRSRTPAMEGEFDLIDVGDRELRSSAFVHEGFRLQQTALSVVADTDVAVPMLADAVRERLDGDGGGTGDVEARRERVAERHEERAREWQERVEESWDNDPISLPRLASEIWEVIEGEEWVVTNGALRGWIYRTWDLDEFDQYIGGYSGGGGIGYGIGAAMGGALAYEETDRVPINLQPDGDLMYYPGALWTMSHYDIPVFTVVHNNQSFYNSTNHRMTLAEFRGRDASRERANVGTGLWDPTPDYATVAEGMGVTGYGPVEEPADLGPTLRDAWETVKDGSPVLVDVVCEPR